MAEQCECLPVLRKFPRHARIEAQNNRSEILESVGERVKPPLWFAETVDRTLRGPRHDLIDDQLKIAPFFQRFVVPAEIVF